MVPQVTSFKCFTTTFWRSFAFACVDGLIADDTIELPWRCDGTVLTVKWLYGSEVKRLFCNEAGRIEAELQAGTCSWFIRRCTATAGGQPQQQ